MTTRPSLVLASASPRRRALLETLGVDFEIRPVDTDESPLEGEEAEDLVLRLALDKARAGARQDEIVLAADTVVRVDGRILGKPADPEEARRLLSAIQGRGHSVLTGVAVLDTYNGTQRSACDRTEVRIAPLDSARIAWYVATGEPMDKAGAYAIQGIGAAFVESVSGNYTNVVGLPLPTVRRLLNELGLELLDFRGLATPRT